MISARQIDTRILGLGDGLGLWLGSGHPLLSGDGLGLGFCCLTSGQNAQRVVG